MRFGDFVLVRDELCYDAGVVAHRLRQLMGSIAEPDKVSLKALHYLSKALRDLRGHLRDLRRHLRDLRRHLGDLRGHLRDLARTSARSAAQG